eukprot:g25798.t1
MPPRRLEFVFLFEHCVGDDQLVFHTFGEQENSTEVAILDSFLSDGSFPELGGLSNSSVEVPIDDNFIFHNNVGSTQSGVEVFFRLITGIKSWRIFTHDHCLLVVGKLHTERHEVITASAVLSDFIKQFQELGDDFVFDDKPSSMNPELTFRPQVDEPTGCSFRAKLVMDQIILEQR